MDSGTLHQVGEGAIYLVALVLSIAVHEFGHAFVADKLGDPLPRAQGRVTLNPLKHIDPIGTLVLPAVAFFAGGAVGARILGWGKPVRISLTGTTPKLSVRTAHALIAIAGPCMNILFAVVLSGALVALVKGGDRGVAANAIAGIIAMNLGLCLFNLLPIPPLDGGAVLARFTPRPLQGILTLLNRYGFMILFALLMIPFRGTTLLGWIMWPASIISDFWLQTVVRIAT
jgi:Zn-dependent protease